MKKKWQGWLIVILGGVIAVRTGANVWKLYMSGDRLKEAKQELVQTKAKNEELNKKLAQVQSPEFMEKEAREKLGLGKEGEVILILPDQKERESLRVEESKSEPNWRKWWNLYIGI